ncbi:MAG: hypothetical protein KatS3mg045_1926 [Bellilinea sp.]|nr:MAG: hypothetical protein KatS3mg045_1926 [Bellilinea sp.]
MRLGLERLNRNPRPGLQALIERAGLRAGELSTHQIVFMLGPRINAAGRMGDARVAVELLIARSTEEASQLADRSRQRRELDAGRRGVHRARLSGAGSLSAPLASGGDRDRGLPPCGALLSAHGDADGC